MLNKLTDIIRIIILPKLILKDLDCSQIIIGNNIFYIPMVWAFRIGQDRDRPCCRTWGRLRWRACRRVLSLPLWCWCFWAFRLVWAEYAVCRWESRASGGHKARQRVYPAWEYCPVKDCRAEYRRQICRRRGRYPVRRALSVGRVQLRSRCRCFFLRIRCFLRFCLKINTPEIHWILGVFFCLFLWSSWDSNPGPQH